MAEQKIVLSRIGKQPVVVPDKVNVNIDGQHVTVKGPLGQLECTLKGVSLEQTGSEILVHPDSHTKSGKAMHGLGRALLQNMVVGVSQGYRRELNVTGVGYRIDGMGNVIKLSVGFSHPVFFELPENVKGEVVGQTKLVLTAIDKELIGQTAARIRAIRPPEPYKGKGISYENEVIRRKAGKSASKG